MPGGAAVEVVRELSAEGVLEVFERVERALALDERRIDGIPWWDLARHPFHRTALTALGLGDLEPPPRTTHLDGLARGFSVVMNLLRAVTTRSPRRARKRSVLIVGHPRRRKVDEHWVDLYVDPLLALLPADRPVEVLEEPIDFEHRRPAATRGLRYLDALRARARWAERRDPGLNAAARDEVRKVAERFEAELGVRLDLEALVALELRRWRARHPRYRALLAALEPEVLLVVRAARQEPLVAAARELGIPVAELQHGSPARGKLNYDYSSGIAKTTFPDLFASFGRFWTDAVVLPRGDAATEVLGFPWLSAQRARHTHVEKRARLLVLSQRDVASALVAFCVALRARLPIGIEVLYKPHPEDLRRGAGGLEALRSAGVVVVEDPNADLYALQASARWQLGVYSTALYEGIAFGCATFVLRAAGAEQMTRLVDLGLARFVSEPSEVDLEFSPAAADLEELFAEASPARAEALLMRLHELRSASSGIA